MVRQFCSVKREARHVKRYSFPAHRRLFLKADYESFNCCPNFGKEKRGEKITMLTAYDYPLAR